MQLQLQVVRTAEGPRLAGAAGPVPRSVTRVVRLSERRGAAPATYLRIAFTSTPRLAATTVFDPSAGLAVSPAQAILRLSAEGRDTREEPLQMPSDHQTRPARAPGGSDGRSAFGAAPPACRVLRPTTEGWPVLG